MAEYIWILKNKDASLFSNPQWRARRRCVWFSASSWELDPQAGLSRNDLDFEGNVQSSNRHSSTILNNYTAALKLKKLSWMNWGTGERIPNAGHFHIIQHDIKKCLSSLLVMTKSSIYDKEAKKPFLFWHRAHCFVSPPVSVPSTLSEHFGFNIENRFDDKLLAGSKWKKLAVVVVVRSPNKIKCHLWIIGDVVAWDPVW